MLKIAVCDDNLTFCRLLGDRLLCILGRGNIELSTFDNGQALIDAIKNGVLEPNAVMMDIKFEQDIKSGVDYAQAINSILPGCQIVFVTEYINYVMDVYRTDHTYFVLKSTMDEYLPRIIEKIEEKQRQMNTKLVLPQKGRQLVIVLNDVFFIERNLHKTSIHCSKSTHFTQQKLEELILQLPPLCFLQCHKSYVVNLEHVSEFQRTQFVLSNGAHVPISRGFYEDSKTAFAAFLGGRL